MCGIIGYVGEKEALPVLTGGLERLEYRGYDSAGVAVLDGDRLAVRKSAGRITNLKSMLSRCDLPGRTGVAHTRWATHGAPTVVNAHPLCSEDGTIAVVHNGIVENYRAIRKLLEDCGVTFVSDTDTEVIAHLISLHYAGDLWDAVRSALREVQGTYGLLVISSLEPQTVVAARMGSPLILGIGQGEHIVASDASAILEHTSQVAYLEDGEIARVRPDGFDTTTLDAAPISKRVQELEWSLEQIEMGGYRHFMEKEIFEQPAVMETCMRGRIDDAFRIRLGGLIPCDGQLSAMSRVVFTGCGTAWHAASVGEYLLEELVRIPAETEYASEFRYRNPIVDGNTVVIAVSQSGETSDTLAAVSKANDLGATTIGVVNVVGSSVARATDAGVYLHVGPETGVASTKAFTGQLTVLAMLACYIGQMRGSKTLEWCPETLLGMPERVGRVLEQSDEIRRITEDYVGRDNWLYLGRGCNYPVAMEGALKLKEISYIHAEGMPAAEMKHGPIALVDDGMPVVFIATSGSQYGKILGNIEEVRARGGRVIAIATEGDTEVARLAEHVIHVPSVPEPLQPLLTVVPLQLIAYHAAVLRGCDVDRPRNLAKSVTVE